MLASPDKTNYLRGWGVFYSKLVMPAPAFAGTGMTGKTLRLLK